MNPVAVSELIQGRQYRIYGSGGCKSMETTAFRTFYGINNDGKALFYEDSMKCPVMYDTCYWTFYSI
jgi:hypothetical protein